MFIRVDSEGDDRRDDAHSNAHRLMTVNQVSDSDTFYDHQLILKIKERFGQIQVLHQTTKRQIQKSYYKVFAKMMGGVMYDERDRLLMRRELKYCFHVTTTQRFTQDFVANSVFQKKQSALAHLS